MNQERSVSGCSLKNVIGSSREKCHTPHSLPFTKKWTGLWMMCPKWVVVGRGGVNHGTRIESCRFEAIYWDSSCMTINVSCERLVLASEHSIRSFIRWYKWWAVSIYPKEDVVCLLQCGWDTGHVRCSSHMVAACERGCGCCFRVRWDQCSRKEG